MKPSQSPSQRGVGLQYDLFETGLNKTNIKNMKFKNKQNNNFPLQMCLQSCKTVASAAV